MSPLTKRRLLGAALILSVLLIPLAHYLGWIHSVVFVNELSLAAIVLSLGAWWSAEGSIVATEEQEDD